MNMTAKRTSIAQLQYLLSCISRLLQALGRHVRHWRAIYSFLAGLLTMPAVVAVVIWYGLFAYPLPWKVTDPQDTRFNVEDFRLTDYENSGDLGRALRVILPVGTPKSQVDYVLSRRGGARVVPWRQKEGFNASRYTYRNLRSPVAEFLTLTGDEEFSWRVSVYFDEDSNLERISVTSP